MTPNGDVKKKLATAVLLEAFEEAKKLRSMMDAQSNLELSDYMQNYWRK